jgi:hypothetical protein
MGRGRAKAKQTKIARELKYASAGGDLAQLQAELAAALDAENHAYEIAQDEKASVDEK